MGGEDRLQPQGGERFRIEGSLVDLEQEVGEWKDGGLVVGAFETLEMGGLP